MAILWCTGVPVVDAADAVKRLKEKIREFNMVPEYISIISVDRRNGVWVIEFMYLFRRYVAEVDEDGRILALKSRSMPLVGSPA